MIFLSYVGLAPFQLSSNSYRVLAAIKSFYTFMGQKSRFVQVSLYLLNLKSNPDRVSKGDGFFISLLIPVRRKYLTIFSSSLACVFPYKPPNYKDQSFWTSGLSRAMYTMFQRVRKYSFSRARHFVILWTQIFVLTCFTCLQFLSIVWWGPKK